MNPFRKNSYFTPTVKEVKYQEGVREHALRITERQLEDKGVSTDITDQVNQVLDERDSRS